MEYSLSKSKTKLIEMKWKAKDRFSFFRISVSYLFKTTEQNTQFDMTSAWTSLTKENYNYLVLSHKTTPAEKVNMFKWLSHSYLSQLQQYFPRIRKTPREDWVLEDPYFVNLKGRQINRVNALSGAYELFYGCNTSCLTNTWYPTHKGIVLLKKQ